MDRPESATPCQLTHTAPAGAGLVFSVEGLGVVGPGMENWPQVAAQLRGEACWTSRPTVVPAPSLLPAAERRRAGASVKLALAVADEACRHAAVNPADVPTVFSSSSADGLNCHLLCEALAQSERLVSPTRFTNSVHNAPAGYWHIGAHSRAASTSLCAFDASFTAGLLEAASQCVSSGRSVLLVVADVPYPEPLHATRPMADAMGVAIVLSARASERSLARVQLQLDASGAPATPLQHAELEALRRSTPAARGLPWLLRLSAGDAQPCVLEGVSSGPCVQLQTLVAVEGH